MLPITVPATTSTSGMRKLKQQLMLYNTKFPTCIHKLVIGTSFATVSHDTSLLLPQDFSAGYGDYRCIPDSKSAFFTKREGK